MAIKTMSGSEPGQNKFARGWHTFTISKAREGSWNGNGYIDIHFEEYGDKPNLRLYNKVDEETKEEFVIAKLFRLANAGIIGVLKDQTGEKPVIQYDDNPEGLVGKKLNVLVVDDKKNPKYAKIWDRVAPIAQEGEHLSYTEDDVTYWKNLAEANYAKYGKPESNGAITDDSMPVDSTPVTDSTVIDEIPF